MEMIMLPSDMHLEIGSLVFDGIDQIDLTGPFEVLSRIPNSTYRLYGAGGRVVCDVKGLRLTPDADLAAPCRANRKAIFNRGMVPNINPNPRGRKQPKRGGQPIFEPAIFKERFRTIERVFAREDKFRRLPLRFERISGLHYAFKILAYTMINLRHYCQI
jgi:hypothetical protein